MRVGWFQTDKGKEFYNSHFEALLANRSIHHYTTGSYKAWLVERFHRSLRELLGRYMTEHETDRYVDVLQPIVQVYNRRYHTALRMSPDEAERKENHFKVYTLRLVEKPSDVKFLKPRFKVGDTVRVSVVRLREATHLFRKTSWQSNFSEAYFVVRSVITNAGPRPMFTLNDARGRPFPGRFYDEELTHYNYSGLSKIEKVLRTRVVKRGRQSIKELLVHWLGDPKGVNEWIKEKDVVRDYQNV